MPMTGYLAFAGVHWNAVENRVQLLPTVVGGPPQTFSLPRIPEDDRRLHGESSAEAYEHAGLVAAREHPSYEVGQIEFRRWR